MEKGLPKLWERSMYSDRPLGCEYHGADPRCVSGTQIIQNWTLKVAISMSMEVLILYSLLQT